MGWVGSLLVEISERADVVRDAPGQAFIAAKHDRGHADVGHSSHVEPAAMEMCFIPAGDCLEGNVRVAGDHRHPGAAVSSRHNPVVTPRRCGVASRLTNSLARSLRQTGPSIAAK